ncbi:hypothetical protein RN001_005500 [Aquatica leii]|uniref:Myb-like domain-containing protein n=1 Tax=Aquatica leii TaxID=1421715 RepID=A0AAN7SAL8_9COLE|nr:hypothetical protein RN001_005500 [Aquatica leii]
MDILNHNDTYDSDADEDILDFIDLLDGPRRPKMIRGRPDHFHLWDNNFPRVVGALDCTHVKILSPDIRFAQDLLDRHKSGEEKLQSQIHNSPASTSMCTTQTGESSLTEVFWSDAETTLLISLYNDHKDAFTNAKKRKHVWDIIAEQMAAHNYFRNPKKLERKWTNLLRVYRSIKDNKGPKKSGKLQIF